MSERSASQTFKEAIETAEFAPFAELFAPDAVLDTTVQTERIVVKGRDAITRQFEEWYPAPARVLSWEERALDGGSLVEVEEAHPDGRYYRYAVLLSIAGGRITEQAIYCSGRLDQETFERNAAQAADSAGVATP